VSCSTIETGSRVSSGHGRASLASTRVTRTSSASASRCTRSGTHETECRPPRSRWTGSIVAVRGSRRCVPVRTGEPRWRKLSKAHHGSVADKMAKKILCSRGSKVVDLAAWRKGRKMALEASFGDEGRLPGKFAGLDPCHAISALAENVSSLMAESLSGMREAKGFVKIAGGAEDEYMPAGPPMSPLTVSYFTMWALFDVRFGSSRETMGSCILRIAAEFDPPSWLIDTVERMQRSRMGFYVHCGNGGDGVLLRDIGTREIVSCAVPAGYAGSEGEIWFVHLLPPPHPLCRHHIVFTTAASQAVMAGENLPLVGKLLGHRRHGTTAGYAHVVDAHLVEAAEKVGSLVARAMDLDSVTPSAAFSGTPAGTSQAGDP